MKRFAALIVLAVLFVGAAAAPAQEAITIKLKERGDGEAALVKKKETTVSKLTVADGGGKVLLNQDETKTEIQEYKETILKREAGKSATKLERAYSKAQSVKGKETTDSPLQDKTVLIEKKEGKYTFTYKGGEEVTGPAAAALAKDFSKKSDNNAELEKLVLPKGAVKIGATWKIDMPKIVDELGKQGGMELDAVKSTGLGTLVKAYKKNGRQFGEMKFKMEMPVVTIGKGVEQLKFTTGAKIVLDLTLDACIDGTTETGTMKMKMLMTGNAAVAAAPGTTVTLNVDVNATQIQEEPAKK